MTAKRPSVFVILLHNPMVNKKGEEVTTAVTNMDIHDIARSCRTFGVEKYFIVNPELEQRRVVERILTHWKSGPSQVYHPWRVEALSRVSYLNTFEEAVTEATQIAGGRPLIAMPDARKLENSVTYEGLRVKLENGEIPGLILVFGTGFGIHPRFFENMDLILEPILGPDSYNHLSVRSAVAIILDRLLSVRTL